MSINSSHIIENIQITFIAVIVSLLLWCTLFVYLVLRKHKTQIMYAFLATIVAALIWSLGNTLEIYSLIFNESIRKIYVYIGFLGLASVPISLFYVGLIFFRTKIIVSWKHYLLLLPPILDLLFVLTNEYHRLFIVQYAVSNVDIVYGKLFMLHSVISYSYLLVGLFFLAFASIKTTGFFSKQSMLIFSGIAVPLTINIIYTTKIIVLNVYLTTISFSIAVLLFVFAILKFNFLNVVPIALRNIVDNISDGFLVIDNDLKIIDFNKTFEETFEDYIEVKRNTSAKHILAVDDKKTSAFNELYDMIRFSMDLKQPLTADKHIVYKDFDKHFKIEVTPINTKSQGQLGMVMLLKDITQNVKDMETIKEKQEILMGQERLASLGQLIGGIAHNLKTPIMSISGGIEGIRDLADEYKDSVGDEAVTDADHKEIADEILEWVEKIKPHCGYMSDIISAVKGQAVQFNTSGLISFTIDEVVKRIDILLKHELIRYHATMKTSVEIDRMTEVRGDINSLVQVLDNLIINAIQSYEGEKGEILFNVTKAGPNVIFIITDGGKGISDSLKEKLFKEMVTTKGKDGTGLGLFMSYSTIKGKFEGDMWFESELGKGTTFYVSIPQLKSTRVESVSE